MDTNMDNRIGESPAPVYYRKPMPLEGEFAPNAETVAALAEDVSGARRFDSAEQLFTHLKAEFERESRE